MMLAGRPVGGDKLIAGPFSQILGSGDRPRWPELPVAIPDRVRCSTPLSQNSPQHRGIGDIPWTPRTQERRTDRVLHHRMSPAGGTVFAGAAAGLHVTSPEGDNSPEALTSVIVKTIEDQEATIQRLRVEVMKGMNKLIERARKEAEIRTFLDECRVKSQELARENTKLQQQNAVLKQQLAELKESPEGAQLEAQATA